MLRSQFCSDRLQNRILASFSPGLTRVMSLLRKFREAERKKADLSLFYFVSKMNVAATQLALLCLINPDSFDEIIRQRGEILVTVSEFMTVLPLANVTQLQNSELD